MERILKLTSYPDEELTGFYCIHVYALVEA